MDGLSVKEAANILGVPKGRVWELIARGVLVGTPEAGGMRVYLHGKRAEALPSPHVEADDEPAPHTNGNGHGTVHEASPFREMLTEFRNLTERYGQALLALGEARGEVAALRSRVELLEARIDLRLPPAPPFVSGSPPQEAPSPPEPARDPAPASVQAPADLEPMAPEAAPAPEAMPQPDSDEVVAEAPPVADVDNEPGPEVATDTALDDEEVAAERRSRARPRIRPRHRRRPSRRAAMEGIALALARAEDPSAPELPGGDDAGAAFAAYRASVEEPEVPEVAMGDVDPEPDQVAAADAVATSEPIPDAFLGDDALGGLLTEVLPAESEPLDEPAIAPQESANEEPVIDALGPRDEAPTAAETPNETPTETPVYSSEWDEPDWIAEEDLDNWDAAQSRSAADSSTSVPVELGASAPPPEPPSTAQDGTEEARDFLADAIEDAFAEPAPEFEERTPEHAMAHETVDETTSDDSPRSSAEDASTEFVADAVADAWSQTDASMPAEPPSAEPEPADSTDAVESADDHEPSDVLASQPEPLDDFGEAAIFPSDPTEVMNALVESGAAVPALEPMLAEPIEAGEAIEYIDLGQSPEPVDEQAVSEPAPPTPSDADAPPQEPADTGVEAGEEALMWLGDEFSSEPRAGFGSATTTPAPITPAEDRALHMLAAERGWDDSELRAIRSLLAQPTTAPLDEAPEHETEPTEDGEDEAPVDVAVAGSAPDASAQAVVADHAGSSPIQGEPEPLDLEDEVMDWEQSPTAWTPPSGAAPSFELPGAAELDAALAAASWGRQPDAPSEAKPESALQVPAPPSSEPAPHPADYEASSPSGSQDTPAAPRAWSKPALGLPIDEPATTVGPEDAWPPERPPSDASEADWLSGRRGPAANAYRRLRRLFPR